MREIITGVLLGLGIIAAVRGLDAVEAWLHRRQVAANLDVIRLAARQKRKVKIVDGDRLIAEMDFNPDTWNAETDAANMAALKRWAAEER